MTIVESKPENYSELGRTVLLALESVLCGEEGISEPGNEEEEYKE